MDKETLRMQMLAGVITESEYKAKLQEGIFQNLLAKLKGNKKPEPVEKSELDDLTDEQAQTLYDEYMKMASSIDPRDPTYGGWSTSYEQTANKIKMKYPNIKGLPTKNESLNEHAIGGIVGIGAINQIPPRAKTDYEDAFEYFLSQKYPLNEAEGDVMVDSMALASYIDELVSLADDMEYTPDMVKGLQDLKAELPGGEMSVENALDVIKQTIDITGDEIGEVEALGQAVDYDDAIVAKAREIAGLDEGKEVEEKYNY